MELKQLNIGGTVYSIKDETARTALTGKQDVIDASHKLSADMIEDGTTNKVINVKPDWNAVSGNDAEILNKPTLATVATSGSYNDLTNKPTIPSLSGYATQTWVNNRGFAYNSDLSNKEIKLNEGTAYIYNGLAHLDGNYLYRFDDVGTLNFKLNNINGVDSSSRIRLFILTGSNPNITFTADTPTSGSPFNNQNSIFYAGSSGVFKANSVYMIDCVLTGYAWVLTLFKLSDTPVGGENGVEETGSGPGWRTIESSSLGGLILVNAAGKVVTFTDQGSTEIFYRYMNNGSYYYTVLSLSSGLIPLGEVTEINGFGSENYQHTTNDDGLSSVTFTLTIDGTEYTAVFNYRNNIITFTPSVSEWSVANTGGPGWRVFDDNGYTIGMFVNAAGKVVVLNSIGNLYVYLSTSPSGSIGTTTSGSGSSTMQAKQIEFGSENYTVTVQSGNYVFTVDGIEYTLIYDGGSYTYSLSPEPSEWTAQ